MKELKNIQEVIDFLQENDELLTQISETLENTPDYFGREVVSMSKNGVKPDSSEGQLLIQRGGFIRNIGQKIMNLFTIELHVTFAGVTLIHFRIPKIKNNQVKEGK